jgi:hypothetical protein
MQHLLVHLPWEAKVGGLAQFKWMYSQERELKKLTVTLRNKAGFEDCITEEFTCKEIMNFSSKYFSRANNVNSHTMRYHIVEEVPLSELSIFQWKGKGVGAPGAHYVTDDEWNYTMLYMLRKIHGDDLEYPRSVPFNPDAAYVAGGDTPHGRYVKISIVFH